MAHGIIHFFPGGTKEQYEASSDDLFGLVMQFASAAGQCQSNGRPPAGSVVCPNPSAD